MASQFSLRFSNTLKTFRCPPNTVGNLLIKTDITVISHLLYTLWIWSYWLVSRHLPYRWMVMDHLANKIFLPAIENLDHDLRFYPMYSLVNYPELLRVNHPNHWKQFYNLLWLRTGLGWFSICFQCQVPNGIYPMGRNQRLKYSFLQWKPGWELE